METICKKKFLIMGLLFVSLCSAGRKDKKENKLKCLTLKGGKKFCIQELSDLLNFACSHSFIKRALTPEEKRELLFNWNQDKCPSCSQFIATNRSCFLCCLHRDIRVVGKLAVVLDDFMEDNKKKLEELKEEQQRLKEENEQKSEVILKLTEEKASMSEQFAKQMATMAISFAQSDSR